MCRFLVGRKVVFWVLEGQNRVGVIEGVADGLLTVRHALNTWYDIGLEQVIEVLK